MKKALSWKYGIFGLVFGIVLVDQVTKIIVVNTIAGGPPIRILGDFLKFTYTENPGMAFGLRFGPPWMVTVFSIFATGLIIVYMVRVGKIFKPYQLSLALVLGGALGNIIDRVFYGVIRGTTPLFQGRVVDFIHVNVWKGRVTESFPFFGGNYIALFPIWNVADMAIVLGVAGIIFFQKKFHLNLEAIADQKDLEKASSALEDATIRFHEPVVPDPDLESLAERPSPGESKGKGDDPRE